MRTVLVKEKVTVNYNGKEIIVKGNGIDISFPVKAAALISVLTNKNKMQTLMDLEVIKK